MRSIDRLVALVLLNVLVGVGGPSLYATDFVPKGTLMGMATQSPTMSRWDLSYGATAHLAFKASFVDWEATPMALGLRAQGLEASYVLYRGSTEEGIYNVYLIGGPMQFTLQADPTQRKVGFSGAVVADYETTQVYGSIRTERYQSSLTTVQTTTIQTLYAPWESSYYRPTLWFGLQGQLEKRTALVSTEESIAPMIRWVSKRWWIDLGIQMSGASHGKIFVQVMHLF